MIGPTDLFHPSPAPHFKTFQVFLICSPKRPSFSTIKAMFQMQHFTSLFLKFKYNLLVKRVFFLLNTAFAMVILDLISNVHLPSFVNKLPKYLKHSTFSSCFCSIIIVTGDGCLEILITFGSNTNWNKILEYVPQGRCKCMKNVNKHTLLLQQQLR